MKALSIRLPEDLYYKLKSYAEEKRVSMNTIVIWAIQEYLKDK